MSETLNITREDYAGFANATRGQNAHCPKCGTNAWDLHIPDDGRVGLPIMPFSHSPLPSGYFPVAFLTCGRCGYGEFTMLSKVLDWIAKGRPENVPKEEKSADDEGTL